MTDSQLVQNEGTNGHTSTVISPSALNTITSNYNIKDFAPTFEFKVMIELAETLARQELETSNGAKKSDIEYLIKLCPATSSLNGKLKATGDDLESDDLVTEYADSAESHHVLLSETRQVAALALGYYLVVSKGKNIERILPLLLSLLKTLPSCKWHTRAKLTPDFFSRHFINLLREISLIVPSTSREICNVFIDSCMLQCKNIMKSHADKFLYESRNATRVLYGILKALSDGLLDFKPEQIRVILDVIQEFIALTSSMQKNEQVQQMKTFKSRLLKSMMVFVIKILYRITVLGRGIRDEDYDNFVAIALRNPSPAYVQRTLSARKSTGPAVKLFTHSVELATQVSLVRKQYRQDTFAILSSILQAVHENGDFGQPGDEEKIYDSVIKGITLLSNDDPGLTTTGVKVLREFAENILGKSERIKSIPIKALCSILKTDYEKNNTHNISHVVYAISNSIYMDKDAEKNNIRITILGEIALQINQPAVTELIRPVLMSQFTRKKLEGTIDVITTGQLAKIAHLGDEKSFEEVVDIIFGIHQNPLHSTDTSLGMVLTNSIYIILDNLADAKLQTILLTRTMKLFIKIASEIQSDSANKTRQREFGQHIGILLPVIAKQLRNMRINPTESSVEIQKLFRTTWYYCLLFDFFNYKEQWNFEFTDACQDMAMYAPVLTSTSKRSFSFIETEKELNVLLDRSRLVAPLAEYQNQLNALVSSTGGHSDLTIIPQATIKKFDFAQVIYLLAVFYLETLRVKSGTFRYSLQYLGDHGLSEKPDFFKCLVSVTDKAFLKWKDFIPMRDTESTSLIENELVFLLKSYCSRSEAIRKSSMVYISIMTKSFTHVFWSNRCIRTLLDLLSALYECADIGKTTDIVSIQIPVEDSNEMETLYLPENYSAREKMLEKFQKLSLDWIKVALTYFPNIVKSHLEEYLLKFSRSFNGQLQHIGYSLAVYMTMPTEYLQKMNSEVLVKEKRKGLSTLSENRFYAMTQSVAVQSYHNGEIDALKHIAKVEGKSLEQLLINNLSRCLKSKANLDLAMFNHYMQLATAYIVAEPTLQVKLLQWLVWTPVFILTKDSMNTAVFCWRWLSSSRPQFELSLLTEMSHAWLWTITQRLGLFNGDGGEGAVELAVHIDAAKNKDDTKPHRIWINYLAERFQVLSSAGKDAISVFVKMLMRSFEDTSVLSTDHNSLGTRFRLCLLAIIVANQAEAHDFPVSLLRDRTYAAILNWFTLHPTWYDPGSMLTVEEDCRVLKELNRKLSLELSSAASSSRTPVYELGLSDNRSGYSERRSTFFGASFSGAASASGSTTRARSTTGTVKTTTSNGYSSKASNLISLILLLVSHEVERMIIWHEPQNADEAIAKANADNSIVTQKIIDPRTWKMYIDTAWSFSPKLALRLPIRFPIDHLRIELQRYAKDFAADLVDIPEAVTYLVTPLNVENNIDELKYLLNWAPATLSVALTFLNIPYVKSPLVAQYAIRTLRKFAPDVVVFYLPQLVQCLRHDSRGILKRYLMSISKRSVMFAHQLIWTLRTEIIPDDYEEMEHVKPAELEMSALSKVLNDEVFAILDERQLALYKEEFGFFDQLNKISGDLIPVDKDLRTAGLQNAMKQITTTPNLYPPTDTKYQITGFDPNGCITLKSAKKVPILVPFHVKERPHGLDIGQEPSEKDKKLYASEPSRDLRLIFKMGDDCRQDQLALQIISMFKHIFKRLDLPLYLYPYRVITTGRDMGIIECVPNSKSRHDLGGFNEGNLYDYFIKKYGHENTIEFQRARKNFIESMAAYSVVSYILNIKDRHNGNLLVDEDGHLIHIDFGFIFDIAPGGNYGIEVRVPFKLTDEMLLLMGENISKEKQQQAKQQVPSQNVSLTVDPSTENRFTEPTKVQDHAEPFNLFVDLVVRGFLASRDHMDSIVAIVEVMLQSELPCFKQDAIKNLKARFCADKPEKEAARFIREKVAASYQSIWSVVYDAYQKRFEGVNC